MNILVVDDDEQMLKTLGRLLEGYGHGVRTAFGGKDALLSIEEAMPDLVLTDIQMPEMDGVTLLQMIVDRFPDMPVILMTGHATVDTAIAALRGRAQDYLKKPVQPDELQACIERVAARRRP